MKKKLLVLSAFLVLAFALGAYAQLGEIIIPGDPDPADWVVFAFPADDDEILPSEGIGDVLDSGTTLNLIINGDDEPEIYVSGDHAVTRIGPNLPSNDDDVEDTNGLLFFRITGATGTIPVNYENNTPETYDASSLTFAGGASLQGVIPANSSGSTTLTVSAPRRGAFPMIMETDSTEITAADASDYAYPHGLMTIIRLNTELTLKVSYNPHGGTIPYGTPASNYPLIRKDLMPYRFLSGGGDLDIDLGTVFFSSQHKWPGSGNATLPCFPWEDGGWDESDYAQKSKALMVRVANWGNDTLDLDLAPLRTGFESFYVQHNRLSCDNSEWPNWPWHNVLLYGEYFNPDYSDDRGTFDEIWPGYTSDDLMNPGTEYPWPLLPGFTAMYWGGVHDASLKDPLDELSAADAYTWPENRTYAAPGGLNRFTIEAVGHTITFQWTAKAFETLGMLYPYVNGDQDILWYNRWDPCSYVPAEPSEYQGSGLVVHMVSFDLGDESLTVPAPSLIDAENASMDWEVADGSMSVEALIPMEATIEGALDDGTPALPLHIFAYTTDPLLTDLNEDAWSQAKAEVDEDTPLDVAFLSHARFSYKGTDLVALAGDDKTNLFRVLGDTGRVITHFFVVVVDAPAPSGEAAVQVKDGYFLLYDGETDGQFDASMVASTVEESGGSDSSGGCSAAGLAPFALLLLAPLALLRRR